jgi:hypothetical protein
MAVVLPKHRQLRRMIVTMTCFVVVGFLFRWSVLIYNQVTGSYPGATPLGNVVTIVLEIPFCLLFALSAVAAFRSWRHQLAMALSLLLYSIGYAGVVLLKSHIMLLAPQQGLLTIGNAVGLPFVAVLQLSWIFSLWKLNRDGA